LTAVIMTAPGTLMMAKMFVPETRVPETMGTVRLDVAAELVVDRDHVPVGQRVPGVDGLEHRQVIVDDEIEDCIEDKVLALGQGRRAGFPMLANGLVRGRGAMPDSDDIALANEDMGFAEGDPAIDKLSRAGDDEQGIAILLDLGPLVRMLGVFDRQFMQMELCLDAQQQLAIGFEQPDPDDMARFPRPFAGLFDRDVGYALAGGVDARGDDAGRCRHRLELSDIFHRSLRKQNLRA